MTGEATNNKGNRNGSTTVDTVGPVQALWDGGVRVSDMEGDPSKVYQQDPERFLAE